MSKEPSTKPKSPMAYAKHGHAYWHRRRIADESGSKANQRYREYSEDPRRDDGSITGRIYPLISEE